MKACRTTLLGVLALACSLSCQSVELKGEAEAVRGVFFLEECEIDLDRYKEKKGPNSLSVRHYDADLAGGEGATSSRKGTEFRIKLSNSYGRKIAISDSEGEFPSGGSDQSTGPLVCKPPRGWWTKDFYYVRLIWDPQEKQALIQLKEKGGDWQAEKETQSTRGTDSDVYEGVKRTRRRVKDEKLRQKLGLQFNEENLAVELIEVDAFGRKIAFQIYQY